MRTSRNWCFSRSGLRRELNPVTPKRGAKNSAAKVSAGAVVLKQLIGSRGFSTRSALIETAKAGERLSAVRGNHGAGNDLKSNT